MKVSGSKSGANRTSGASKTSGNSTSAKTSSASASTTEAVSGGIASHNSDAVEVSDNIATIEIIRNLVSASPDVRMDQVEKIQKQLKNGSYKINYEKVAEAFIREVIVNEIARKK